MATTSKTNDKQQQNEKFVPSEQNALQKHVFYFDRNQDGIIYPWETFQGMRAIGFGVIFSIAGALFINIGLSQKTRPGKSPSLFFPIEVRNIQKAKHGSDSGVYNNEGSFVHEKFEEIFRKHARSEPDALTSGELMAMLRDNRQPKDYPGWIASWVEWKALYILCKESDGFIKKETIRAAYDGTLFEHLEKKKLSAKKKKAVV